MEQSNFEYLKIKKENEELKKKLQEMEEKMKATNLNKPEPTPTQTQPSQPTSPIPPPGYGVITYPVLPQSDEIARIPPPPYAPSYESPTYQPPSYQPPSQPTLNSHNDLNANSNSNANTSPLVLSPSAPPVDGLEKKNYEEFLQIGLVEYSAQNSPIGPTTTEIPFNILSSGENGSKYFKRKINFPSAFKTNPHVLVFLAGFEVAVNDDHRINVSTEDIDTKGFTLVVSTWGKTIIKQVSVSWFAYLEDLNKSSRLFASGREQFKRGLNNWNLTGALGDRTFHYGLKFNKPAFATHAPSVFTAFSLLDVLNIDDLRIITNTRDDSKSKENVTLDISTWLATQVWSTHVSWIAIDHSLSQDAPVIPELGRNVLVLTGRRPFKKNMPSFTLCEGSGPRTFAQQVQFPRVFEKPPIVLLALSGLDLLTSNDHCIKCEASQITDRSFTIALSTWGDGNIWSASVSWIAIGDPHPSENSNPDANRIPSSAKNPIPISPPLGASQAVPDDDKLCKICFDKRVNTVIIPCGHIALCWDCGEKIKTDIRGNMTCPMCKSPFTDIIKTYAS